MFSNRSTNKGAGRKVLNMTLKTTTKNSKKGTSNNDESVCSTEPDDNNPFKQPPSYDSLNNKLMYPNNPAYFHIKKLSSIEHKAKKFLDAQGKKTQTLLEYCREQGIAFTDTDKVMYNLQTSKKLHYLLKQFVDKNMDFIISQEDHDQAKNAI